MLDNTGRYTLQNYGQMEPFCSFLPGIAGETGVPLWCYYVNRGQAVSSFGVEDKDHAIMEFFPAHQAYQYTDRVGWRTFLKMGGQLVEPFSDATQPHSMRIGMNDLSIAEERAGVKTDVSYFTLPEERGAALVRQVALTNTSAEAMDVDLLDGMPAILPFGINLHSTKHMTQTAKAWMQAEDTDKDLVFFRVRASMEDTSDIQEVNGVNFAFARTEDGDALPVFVDPRHIFGYDSSLARPLGFLASDFDAWQKYAEVTENILPCCFFARQIHLEPGESCSHTILVGQAESKARAQALCRKMEKPGVLAEKHQRANELVWQLTDAISSKTGDPTFDMYCRQTYLDNLLRGGTPVELPGGKVTYLYSRKHGDPERDYNAFRMRAEYYSQGNGNFRDVNQNRRCDVLFFPQVGMNNVRTFFNLVQADGYNPLVVEYLQYTLSADDQAALCALVNEADRPAAEKLLSATFTPGSLRMALEDWQLAVPQEEFFARAMAQSKEGVAATFGEGYWTDHWTYNLDQIESYLSVYPEQEEALLFQDESYTWYRSPEGVLPRAKRYVVTDRGVRQYSFLQKQPAPDTLQRDENGQVLYATLMEKLVSLITVKAATLDPYGMGIEMEAGKPGWYDALNGLPGLLGSSVAETLELKRILDYTLQRLERFGHDVALLPDVAALMRGIVGMLQNSRSVWMADGQILPVWNVLNDLKEDYRQKVKDGLSGAKETLPNDLLCAALRLFADYVGQGIAKAMKLGGGLCPTYFSYNVTAFTQDDSGLHPTAFEVQSLPTFLEGQVRYLRLDHPAEEKQRLTHAVRSSRLYDQKLRMFKVNAALSEASYEIGRAHAFTAGWLENESIWLHMEYKYLLELLRSGLHKEFADAFHDAAVPFQDPAVYGRSPLENSSFIASSANPDPRFHGKGFVARLSGSTAELLSIWQIMLLGKTLFTLEDGQLQLNLAPVLPAYLTQGRDQIEATLLSKTRVVYHIQPGKAYLPGQYAMQQVTVRWQDGSEESFAAMPQGDAAQRIRRQEAAEIHVSLS